MVSTLLAMGRLKNTAVTKVSRFTTRKGTSPPWDPLLPPPRHPESYFHHLRFLSHGSSFWVSLCEIISTNRTVNNTTPGMLLLLLHCAWDVLCCTVRIMMGIEQLLLGLQQKWTHSTKIGMSSLPALTWMKTLQERWLYFLSHSFTLTLAFQCYHLAPSS